MKASEIENIVVRSLLRGASRAKPITERETRGTSIFEILRERKTEEWHMYSGYRSLVS